MRPERRRSGGDTDDGMPVEPLAVARDAYRGHRLRPLGARVNDLPLRRCPGCQSRSAAPIGLAPGGVDGRVVYACNVCRRRHFADVD